MENLKVLADKYNLEVLDDKLSFLETLEAIIGKVEGYYVNVLVDLRDYIVKINIDSNGDRNKIKAFLDSLKLEIKEIKETECKKNYIRVVIKEGKSRTTAEIIGKVIDRTVQFLSDENIKSACGFCGDENAILKATSVIKNESETDFICEECHQKRIKELEENREEIKNMKENHILGFLGSFLGAFIGGGILWIILGMFGFIGSISVVGIIIGGLAGYTMFTKKMGVVGSFLFVVASGMAMAVAHFIEVSLQFKKLYGMSVLESIRELIDYTTNSPEIAREVWLNPYFVIAFAIVILVGIFSAKSASRDSQGIYSVRRD